MLIIALFRKRRKADPEPLVTRGREALRIGNYEEALECFSDALELDPSAADVHYYRAMCFHNAKRWDEAARDLRRGVELGLDPPTMAEHYLAKALFHAGQYEESISLFSGLLANNPDGFGQVTPYEWFELRGMARCKHGDFNAAKKDLEEARAALPAGSEVAEQGPITYWLLVCKHEGDEARAREEWLG